MSAGKEASGRFKHAPHAAWRKVGEETIILDLNTSVYYSLNDTGSFVWEKLGAGAALPEIARAVSDEFDVPLTTADRDVVSVVDELRKEKLLLAA